MSNGFGRMSYALPDMDATDSTTWGRFLDLVCFHTSPGISPVGFTLGSMGEYMYVGYTLVCIILVRSGAPFLDYENLYLSSKPG